MPSCELIQCVMHLKMSFQVGRSCCFECLNRWRLVGCVLLRFTLTDPPQLIRINTMDGRHQLVVGAVPWHRAGCCRRRCWCWRTSVRVALARRLISERSSELHRNQLTAEATLHSYVLSHHLRIAQLGLATWLHVRPNAQCHVSHKLSGKPIGAYVAAPCQFFWIPLIRQFRIPYKSYLPIAYLFVVRERTNVTESIIEEIRRRLSWFGHMSIEWRLIQFDWLLTRALYCHVTGERSQGRQAKWMENIKEDFELRNIQLKDVVASCKDRTAWRQLINIIIFVVIVMTDEKEEEVGWIKMLKPVTHHITVILFTRFTRCHRDSCPWWPDRA